MRLSGGDCGGVLIGEEDDEPDEGDSPSEDEPEFDDDTGDAVVGVGLPFIFGLILSCGNLPPCPGNVPNVAVDKGKPQFLGPFPAKTFAIANSGATILCTLVTPPKPLIAPAQNDPLPPTSLLGLALVSGVAVVRRAGPGEIEDVADGGGKPVGSGARPSSMAFLRLSISWRNSAFSIF